MTKVRYGYATASLVLVLFYGYVVWLMFVPSTSQNYRLYFLDHKLKYWPQRNGLNYAFGEIIDFSDIVDYVSAQGWDDPGQSGTWTNGRKATLYLRTPAFSDGRPVLCATVRGSEPPDPRLRAVQIRVNGKLAGTWAFGTAAGWRTERVVIPPGAMKAGGLQRLTFVIEGAGDRAARLGISRLRLTLDGTRGCRDPGGLRATAMRGIKRFAEARARAVAAQAPGGHGTLQYVSALTVESAACAANQLRLSAACATGAGLSRGPAKVRAGRPVQEQRQSQQQRAVSGSGPG